MSTQHADDRNALPEDGDGPAVQTLAHLALVAAGIAHRLCRPGEESVRDAVSELEARLNREIRAAGVELSDEMLDAALDEVRERMSAGGRGGTISTPSRENGGLDREELDALALDLARIGEAASMGDFKFTEDQLRTGMRAAGQKVDELIDRLYAKVGVTVDDSLLRPLHEKARRWRDDLLDEPSGNPSGKSDDSPGEGGGNRSTACDAADTVEIPRRLVEELVQAGNLLAHALPDLTALEAPSFVALEVARQLTREYASRVDEVVVKLEKALGVEDTDKLFEGVRETYGAAARAKRRELAEELGGAS